ncbi:MAG: hypothetical protein AAGI52_06670 [Bacteroidota bacterium]
MLSARLRITSDTTSTEEVYEDARIGARDIEDVIRAADGEVELPNLTLSIDSDSFLGAASKPLVPRGRHRAIIEVSRDAGPWEAVVDGIVTYETVGDGRAYGGGDKTQTLARRTWSVRVVNDAMRRVWEALEAVSLQDVAPQLEADVLEESVPFKRTEGGGTTTAITCTMYPLVAALAEALDQADVGVVGSLSDPFPWERLYDDGATLRLARDGESNLRRVLIGRPQLQGAPADADLHGLYPTMPQEHGAWLLDEWRKMQELRLSARYAAYPNAGIEIEIADVQAQRDPTAPAFQEIESLADDGWRRRTQSRDIDGQLIGDAAMVYGGGPDGSAVEDADRQPLLRATYASSRIALTGTPGEREVDNRSTFTFPFRLAAHVDIATSIRSTAHPGYSETVHRGTPVFDITTAYVGPSGPTAEQDGDGDRVMILVAERDLATDPWKSVDRREASRTAGVPLQDMELWASGLYRRHALTIGDVDVVTCSLLEDDLDLANIDVGDPRAGVLFDGDEYAVVAIERNRDTKNVALTLHRPSGGWAVVPASGESGAGNTQTGAQQLAPNVSVVEISRDETTDELGDPITYFTLEFLAEVPAESAPPTGIQVRFAPNLLFDLTTSGPYVLRAYRQESEPGHGAAHSMEGQQFEARAVYGNGFATAWQSVTASET